MKIKVKCEDPHNPQGIFEFSKEKAERLVKESPHYSFVTSGTTKNVYQKKEVFKEWMTEKDIKKKIEDKKIPIDYNITNDEKKDILKQLESLGHVVEWKEE